MADERKKFDVLILVADIGVTSNGAKEWSTAEERSHVRMETLEWMKHTTSV